MTERTSERLMKLIFACLLMLFSLSTSAQYVAGQLSVSDQDAGQSHTWQIISGNYGNYFSIDTAGVIWVDEQAYTRFTTSHAWNLGITCTDDGICYQYDGSITLQQPITTLFQYQITLYNISGKPAATMQLLTTPTLINEDTTR